MELVGKHLSRMDVLVHSHGKRNEGILDISPKGIDKWSGLQKLGIKEMEYVSYGNDANDITMFKHADYAGMIGENSQLSPYSSEQLPLSEDIEKDIVK